MYPFSCRQFVRVSRGNHFVFVFCCHVHVFCKYAPQKNHVAQFRALSVFYLKKLSMGDTDASHALAESDTILLWPSEEHLQHTICLTLSNGKIKANPNKIHSLQLWVGRWWDHQRGTARSTMSSHHIIIVLSPPLSCSLSLPSSICPLLSVTFLLAKNCLSSHKCHIKLSWLYQNSTLYLYYYYLYVYLTFFVLVYTCNPIILTPIFNNDRKENLLVCLFTQKHKKTFRDEFKSLYVKVPLWGCNIWIRKRRHACCLHTWVGMYQFCYWINTKD